VIDVDLLNFDVIKLAFYKIAIQIFPRIRRRICAFCGYAILNLQQFACPSVRITFVERRGVGRLNDADRVSDVEVAGHSCFL